MKLSCTQENLHQGLLAVSHIAGKNINLPILGNVLVKCDEKILRLMTTNLEIAVNCTVRGKIEEGGEFTVPSRLFSDYISLLPRERVDINLEGAALSLTCGEYRTKFHGTAASEFPLIPAVEGKYVFSVKTADFKRAVNQVLFSVAPNESRPEISGVLCKFAPAGNGEISLILAGTDSYRLAEKSAPATVKNSVLSDSVSVIVPARTVAELVRIMGIFRDSLESPDVVEIAVGENQALFSIGNVQVISRTIEGKYPDYRQLVPERFESEIILLREDLLRAVKTASLFSKTGLNDVHIEFQMNGKTRLSSTSATGEHNVEIPGEIKGKENSMTLNFKYLLDGVSTIETDSVAVQLIDGMSPCLLRPYDGKTVKSDYLYIVMPIRQ